jgi:transposase-like protein
VHPEIQDLKKRAFALAFARTGNKAQAARVAGIHPDTPYSRQWRSDQVLQAALRQAKEVAADLIEAEAYRRAVHGVERPTGWYQGKPGAMVREYSDLLTIFLLKGLRPERYKERVEMRGALANLDMNLLPDEAIDRIANGEPVMAVLASMVPRAGEALPGLLKAPSEPAE